MAYLSPLFGCKLVVADMATKTVATIIRLTDGAVMGRHTLPPRAVYVELRYPSQEQWDYALHYRITGARLSDRCVIEDTWPEAPLCPI